MKVNNDLSICVAFHIGMDDNVDASIKTIDNEVWGLFEKEDLNKIVTQTENECEVMYQIQKPLLVSGVETDKFFKSLQRLFKNTQDFFPHFTANVEHDA